jgi:KaiC/GvpD/RAD55 family RecA-like ATPase
MVEYHFIQTGLQKGEYCIYTTHEDDVQLIEKKMADFGIDIEGYKRTKRLSKGCRGKLNQDSSLVEGGQMCRR